MGIPPSMLGRVGEMIQKYGQAPNIGNTKKINLDDTTAQLEFFKRCKREAFADRWIFERQWTRVIHYLNMRQWLAPYSRAEGWREARLAKGVPKPCTSKPKEIDQSIRAMFAAIRFGVVVRPANQSQSAMLTASTADDLAPLLHDVHRMNDVMSEFDYWFVNLGNSVLHTWWDVNARYGVTSMPYEICSTCRLQLRTDQIAASRNTCPHCHGTAFTVLIDPETGRPKEDLMPKGSACTTALSPFELAWPMNYPRWADVPFVIRMYWWDKYKFEEDERLRPYLDTLKFSKGASERSLQIFQSLPFQNDMAQPRNAWMGQSGSTESEGIAVYELWARPTPEHPEGRVIRVAGEHEDCTVLELEDEGLPGDLPYHDQKGNPLFTFAHAGYQTNGGRTIASGVHDHVIHKYDAINRLDSLLEMIAMRMAAPQWMVPKGAGAEWLGNSPGMPGLLLQWNAQIAGVNGRPERIPGMPPDTALVQLREMHLKDIEEGTGTYDILRGSKPAGVEAFSAMQLLVESGQKRFSSAFQSRGDAYRQWFTFALELEREFGPDTRTLAVLTPAKSYAFRTFKKANLSGDVDIVIEDGTYTPKTSLGERAAVEHLNSLGLVEAKDPDIKYAIYSKFGMSSLLPGLNAHVQAARRKQENFERWMAAGGFQRMGEGADPTLDPTYPLRYLRWFDAQIHRQEFIKWANADTMISLMLEYPAVEGLLTAHLMEIDLAIQEQMMGVIDPAGKTDPSVTQPQPGGAAPGASQGMANSNQNSGAVAAMPVGGSSAAAAPPA